MKVSAWLVAAVIASSGLHSPCARAQTASAAELAACKEHGQDAAVCNALVFEFSGQKQLLAAGAGQEPVLALDNPIALTNSVAARLAPRALAAQLATDLKQVSKQELEAAVQTVSTAAAVTQTGGAPTAGGSTNLATKPTTTDLISLASETGAFTDTTNGSSVSLQANALGLWKFFNNLSMFDRVNSQAADRIQPLNFTATLNVAQASASATPTSGPANALTPASLASILIPSNNASFSSFTASYVLYRPYNPQDQAFQKSWAAALASNKQALTAAGSAVAAAVNKLTPPQQVAVLEGLTAQLHTWHTEGAAAESSGNFAAFVAAYSTYDDAVLNVIMQGKDAPANVLTLGQALDAFSQATYKVLDDARGTPLATVNYTYTAAGQKPATHAGTAAVSYLFKGGTKVPPGGRTFLTGAQFTGNFTATVYQSLPAGATYGRFRDVQISSEFDKPFGGTSAAPRGTLSVAGYGQYQFDPTVLNITAGNLAPGTNISLPSDAQVLLGTSGWLGVVQGKVVLNLSKGLSVPVALKWSNKTDLLQANDVRGQIGISYDLSALSSLLNGK